MTKKNKSQELIDALSDAQVQSMGEQAMLLSEQWHKQTEEYKLALKRAFNAAAESHPHSVPAGFAKSVDQIRVIISRAEPVGPHHKHRQDTKPLLTGCLEYPDGLLDFLLRGPDVLPTPLKPFAAELVDKLNKNAGAVIVEEKSIGTGTGLNRRRVL